ncbi:hypothetical protein [Pseudomonas laurentiana]
MGSPWSALQRLVALGFAAWLAVVLSPQIKLWFPSYFGKYDDLDIARYFVPLATAIFALLLTLLIELLTATPQLRRLLDRRAIFLGMYLSLPANRDHVHVFSLRTKVLSKRYALVGYGYSLQSRQETACWHSDKLEINPVQPMTLVYAYAGDEIETGERFDGHGYVKIKFFGTRPERGEGYWIDVPDHGSPRRFHSNYLQVTPELRRQLFKRVWWLTRDFPFIQFRGFVSEHRQVFEAFAALSSQERDAFRRPNRDLGDQLAQKPEVGASGE